MKCPVPITTKPATIGHTSGISHEGEGIRTVRSEPILASTQCVLVRDTSPWARRSFSATAMDSGQPSEEKTTVELVTDWTA